MHDISDSFSTSEIHNSKWIIIEWNETCVIWSVDCMHLSYRCPQINCQMNKICDRRRCVLHTEIISPFVISTIESMLKYSDFITRRFDCGLRWIFSVWAMSAEYIEHWNLNVHVSLECWTCNDFLSNVPCVESPWYSFYLIDEQNEAMLVSMEMVPRPRIVWLISLWNELFSFFRRHC